MSISKHKSLLANLGLCLFSIVITLIVLEIAVRIFAPGAHKHQWLLIQTYHPQAGYQLQKNLDIEIDSGNGPHRLKTNEYGYIGETYPLEKPDNEFRIANFGDSYVEGVQMVHWDGTFVHLLGKKLNERVESKNFRSLNFGLGGRGTIEEFWTYKYVAETTHPDLNILWFTMSNDFANNYLPVSDNTSLAENKMGKVKYFLKKSALVSYIFEHLKDNLAFISVLQHLGLSNKVAYTGEENIETDTVPFDNKVNFSTKPEMKEIQEHAYNVTEEILQNFKNLSYENDEDFFVVVIPGTIYLSADLQKEFFEVYDVSPNDYDFSKGMNQIKNILERNEISFIDLTEFIRKYEAQELDNFDYCGDLFEDHFTPCGHESVAEFVSRYVVEKYIESVEPENGTETKSFPDSIEESS